MLICLLSIPILGIPHCPELPVEFKNSNGELPTNDAFLTTYIVEDQLYLNIPEQILDKPILFIRYDQSYERKYMQVVWSLHKDNILLKVPSIQSTAGIVLPIKTKLPLSENILAVFSINKEKQPTGIHRINITDLVLKQDIEWKPGFTENLVPQITFLLDTKDMENEVIIRTQRGVLMENSKVSLPVHFGFYGLEKPMKARRYDYRMGFYNEVINGIPYGTHNSIANISRWRLNKKDNGAKISVPVKPITFILSPEIPKKWRPYIKLGIEQWSPAFEAAGFKDALVVKEMDSLGDWQRYSINTSIVYWGQKKYLRGSENEDFGGTVSKIVDLRSGEILKGDIHLGASPQNLSEEFFIRCAPLDKRARKFPFPDELIGEMYTHLAGHEVGHVFGLMDSNYGEYAYPFDKMNDSIWLKKMGHTPSIMNYSRPNNLPQPEDSVPPSLLIQKVGPADIYSIEWAYTEIAPEKQEAWLERIIRRQDSVPWYRYNNGQHEIIGPANTNEIVETNDPVQSTTKALKNIKRVIELLPEVSRRQKDNALLERLYDKTLELWYRHMRHVISLIAGYEIHYKSIDQPGSMYTPVPLKSQEEALDFIMLNAFNPPDWLVRPEFETKIKYTTYPDKVLAYQQRLLLELLRPQRMKRFEYLESVFGYERVFEDFFATLRMGLFPEPQDQDYDLNPRKMELQMTYIDKLLGSITQERMNITPYTKAFDYTDYTKGILMQQLIALKPEIERRVSNNREGSSKGHWKLCLKKINTLL